MKNFPRDKLSLSTIIVASKIDLKSFSSNDTYLSIQLFTNLLEIEMKENLYKFVFDLPTYERS